MADRRLREWNSSEGGISVIARIRRLKATRNFRFPDLNPIEIVFGNHNTREYYDTYQSRHRYERFARGGVFER